MEGHPSQRTGRIGGTPTPIAGARPARALHLAFHWGVPWVGPNGIEVYSVVKERGMLAAGAATVSLYHNFKNTVTILLIFIQENLPRNSQQQPWAGCSRFKRYFPKEGAVIISRFGEYEDQPYVVSVRTEDGGAYQLRARPFHHQGALLCTALLSSQAS